MVTNGVFFSLYSDRSITAVLESGACKKVLREIDMTDTKNIIEGNLTDVLVFKNIFDWFMETTITDEQAYRVIEPVLKMIKEGKFSRTNGYGNYD